MSNNSDKKKIGILDRIPVYLICVVTLCFIIVFFVSEKKTFSQNENRKLAQMPEFNFEKIKSGDFTSGFETFVADQFPARDAFMRLMAEVERITGRKEINDIYLAKDGSLIERYKYPKNTAKQIDQFSKLAVNVENARCMLMMVPTAVSVYSDLLPENANDPDLQQQIISDIYSASSDKLQKIDVSTRLKDEAKKTVSEPLTEDITGNRLFYRTDHHWTTYGAYIGYEAFCEAAGLTPIPLSEYTGEIVSENFKGTIYSKLNDPYFGADRIVSYSYPDWKLSVEYSDTEEVTDTPYNKEYLSEKDQYSYFLNNIHPLITITNDAVQDGAIALVKDSYANSIVPFLLAHYHTVYVFDTRYYKGGPSKFINEHPEISDVLILYNMNTIDNDTGIGGIF
ncbi:DHHW family protein [Butyrivibrio sp. INlla16]|uniref:DHHW family protein n=1 Tax=Butyrivibrio sp. INlla16 TaxID=1520807 RepID=UPI000891A5F5|nr:DHHW family protein [Butyrivibrio sp. INlla16]SDB34790.1 DHHW protein [Butyrivibrio sp. INlla16]